MTHLQWWFFCENSFQFQVVSLESRTIVPLPPPRPRLLIFRFFSTQDIFIPIPPLLLIFSHFCSHFWVSIAIFTIIHHKEKEIVQPSTITVNYVNRKHMLSLWDPIVGMSIVQTYVMNMITKVFGRIYLIKFLKFHRFLVFLYCIKLYRHRECARLLKTWSYNTKQK